MISIRKSISIFCTALLVAGILSVTPLQASPAVELLTQYFDMLVSGNLESAQYLWTESDQERANRFGIEYIDIPIRVDATSPVVENFGVMRAYLNPPVKRYQDLADGFVSMEYSAMLNSGKPVEYTYYAQKIGEYYWLCHPQDYYARNWPVIASRYFRIHYEPDLEPFLGAAVLKACDEEVEHLMDSLDFDKDTKKLVEEKKVEYYYCKDDETVKDITGHLTKGMLDQATNDIISANFPHFHELTHLLTNIKLQKIYVYTLPVLREGLAVRYGGRWGKEPPALMDIGAYLYKEQLVVLDSMLTYYDFINGSSADISYPVAGLFVTFLMDRAGNDKFFELYRAASGPSEKVTGMDRDEVKNLILSYTGHKDWLDLEVDFTKYLDSRVESQSAAVPGADNNGKELLAGNTYKVTEHKDWLSFVFTGNGDGPVKGNLLFGYKGDLDGQQSMLFQEQYLGQEPFEGYRFGVRYDENEVGLYDYATNQLVAKYIWGISPSPDYFDADSKTVTVRFKRDLVDGNLPEKVHVKWLPY